ncbi:MAG: hypothetical protein AAF655_21415 [Bacteroidota bacterium]
MKAIDPRKVRDPQYRKPILERLKEIALIREQNTYLAYAMNKHLFEELSSLYDENLSKYEQSYLAAKALHEELAASLQPEKLSLSTGTREELQNRLKELEAGIQAESYEENTLSLEKLQQLSEETHQLHQQFEHSLSRCEQLARLMESHHTDYWEEDLTKLREQLHTEIEQLHEGRLPTAETSLSEEVVLHTQTVKKQALDQLAAKTKHKPFLKKIEEIKTKAVSINVLQQLEKDIASRKKRILAGQLAVGISVMLLLLVGIRMLPKQLASQQETQVWEHALQANTYMGYQEYLEAYPRGSHTEEALNLQNSVSEVDQLVLVDALGREMTYTGNMKAGLPSGEGKMDYQAGAYYEGMVKEGLPQGVGKMVYEDGATYSGDWQAGQREGEGIQQFANGQVYEGEWKEDTFHGQGIYRYKEDHAYSGNWVEGKKEGKGVLEMPDGEKYEGLWRAGKRHGKGKQLYEDGSRYSGEWKEDLREGKGIMTYADSKQYAGEWKKDTPHGKGSLSWESGGSFEGSWKAGSIKGQGTFIDRFRAEYNGQWEERKDTIIFKDINGNTSSKGRFSKGMFLTY